MSDVPEDPCPKCGLVFWRYALECARCGTVRWEFRKPSSIWRCLPDGTEEITLTDSGQYCRPDLSEIHPGDQFPPAAPADNFGNAENAPDGKKGTRKSSRKRGPKSKIPSDISTAIEAEYASGKRDRAAIAATVREKLKKPVTLSDVETVRLALAKRKSRANPNRSA
jgi:hypothetical protein